MVSLRRRHRATLEAIFSHPTRANIRWHNVESLLLACGAHIEERAGSRVRVRLGDLPIVLHHPHPGNEISKGTVATLRTFLTKAGITPDQE